MDVAYVEPVRDGVIDVLDAVPRPVKYRLVPKHQERTCDAKYDENHKSQHAKEPKGADESSREGELHPHEDGSLYSGVYPPDEPYKAILIL